MSTPASQVEPEKFSHEALFYSGWPEFIIGTVPFIRGGLEAGEPVLVVESAEKIEMLRIALDHDAKLVHFADMAEVGANPARIIPAWRDFVQQNGGSGRRVRGIGEPIWKGRTADQLIECQRHESLLNVAFGRGLPWRLLCPYDAENLDPSVIEEARRSHEFVIDGGHMRQSSEFRGLDASGAPFDVPLPEPQTRVTEMEFGAESLLALRLLVSRHAIGAGVSPSRAAELVTAVNEVATNSIRHGGGKGQLRVWQDLSTVICEVSDPGRIDGPLIDRERPAAQLAASRGLWLANQLCDLVQIRTFATGTAVRLHMRRDDEHPLRGLDLPHSGSSLTIN